MLDVIKSHYKNLGKFGVVGVVNTTIDFAIYTVLIEYFGFYFIWAHICGFLVAVINSFFLNALWTFKNLKRDMLFYQVFCFILIALVGLVLSLITIGLVESIVGNVYIAKVVATGVTFIWNYTGSFLFVFGGKDKKDKGF